MERNANNLKDSDKHRVYQFDRRGLLHDLDWDDNGVRVKRIDDTYNEIMAESHYRIVKGIFVIFVQ